MIAPNPAPNDEPSKPSIDPNAPEYPGHHRVKLTSASYHVAAALKHIEEAELLFHGAIHVDDMEPIQTARAGLTNLLQFVIECKEETP